jgi:hypothetical protein
MSPVVFQLRLSWVRYGAVAAIFGALAAGMAYLSVQPTLAKPSMTAKGQAIGRVLMSIDPIAGVWPLAALTALAFSVLCLFLLWALTSKRPFELTMNAQEVTWPSLAPWRAPRALSWSEITSVGTNPARDHLVFNTANRRQLLPAWWLPQGTSLEDVIRAAATFTGK